jgi:hypothetical protein
MSQNTVNNDIDSLMSNGNEVDDNSLSMTTREQQKGTQVHGIIYNDNIVEKFVKKQRATTVKCK